MKTTNKTREILSKRKLARADIGCGANKQDEDWFGIDPSKKCLV